MGRDAGRTHQAVAAVARGAKVIEKHFTLRRSLPSPDAPLALEPNEFDDMVKGIRAAESASGDHVRLDIFDEEDSFKKKISTRLILATDKKAGDIFRSEDFQFLRYPSGVDCKDLDTVLNKKSAKVLKVGDVLNYSDVG